MASSCSAIKWLTDQAIAANSTKPDKLMIATYKIVSRKLDVRNGLGRGTKATFAAAHRFDQIRAPVVDLAAQPADVAFYKIGMRVEMEPLNALKQHGPRHHLIGMLDKKLQQFVFPRL